MEAEQQQLHIHRVTISAAVVGQTHARLCRWKLQPTETKVLAQTLEATTRRNGTEIVQLRQINRHSTGRGMKAASRAGIQQGPLEKDLPPPLVARLASTRNQWIATLSSALHITESSKHFHFFSATIRPCVPSAIVILYVRGARKGKEICSNK
jgi:hypothetical protein